MDKVRTLGYGQIGQKFIVKPSNADDIDNVIPLSLENYERANICIRQPDGEVKEYPGVVTGAPELERLVLQRVDSEPPIDDTHINDGNDGVNIPGSSTPISVSPLNTAGKNTYVEIPPGATLVFFDGASSFSPNVIWAFFQGQPNAKIIIRLHDSNATVSWESNEVGPNANNDAINTGLTGATTHRTYQSIENTGTETAYYAGWVGRPIGGDAPINTGNRNFRHGDITTPEIVRPFTFISVVKGKTLVLKRATVQPNIDNLLLYIRGAALTSLRIWSFKDGVFQGQTNYRDHDVNRDGDDPISVPIDYEFNELEIRVDDDTNGALVNFGGVSIEATDGTITQITDWEHVLITNPSIFPFDENLNTETNVTDGVWFTDNPHDKTLVSVAITRPEGTVDNPDVDIEYLFDVVPFRKITTITPKITDDDPEIVTINLGPYVTSHFKLVSTAQFRLHELNITALDDNNLADPIITYQDNEGILTQRGLLEFWAKVYYKNGTSRTSNRRAVATVY